MSVKLNIGTKSIEIKDAINTLEANIKWLKRKLIVVSNSTYGKQFMQFYTQKIEAQEALVDLLTKHDELHNCLPKRKAG